MNLLCFWGLSIIKCSRGFESRQVSLNVLILGQQSNHIFTLVVAEVLVARRELHTSKLESDVEIFPNEWGQNKLRLSLEHLKWTNVIELEQHYWVKVAHRWC